MVYPPLTSIARLGLIVGNTRLHWVGLAPVFTESWHTPHLSAPQAQQLMAARFSPEAWAALGIALPPMPPPTQLWIAGVVGHQLDLWSSYAEGRTVCTAALPVAAYPSLGVDRALALLGAKERYGWPALVVDAGTALTLTAAGAAGFMGGQILPGLALQLRSLATQTDSLPAVTLPDQLPPPWGQNTVASIQSGVVWTVLAGLCQAVEGWRSSYPSAPVILTGGDAERLYGYIQGLPEPLDIAIDLNLAFRGLRIYADSP